MKDTVSYKQMEGHGLTKYIGKKATYKRDFGATKMNIEELARGIKRAFKRMKRSPEKIDMYNAQIVAYRDRINWYYDGK